MDIGIKKDVQLFTVSRINRKFEQNYSVIVPDPIIIYYDK